MKKLITIRLYLSLLYYDVRNKAWLTGRSRSTGQNQEEVAYMQASDDEEEAGVLMRSVRAAIGELKVGLNEYLLEDDASATNIPINPTRPDDKDVVCLVLVVPLNYSESMTGTLAAAAHRYVVEKALGDWFLITNKGDAQDCATLAMGQLGMIREAINKRTRPVRP